MYSEKFQEFYVALHDLRRWNEFAEQGIKWLWPYPITSYYELHSILALRPAYVMLGAPLSFDLDRVRKLTDPLGVKVRMSVNQARPSYLPVVPDELSGVCGQWVRPEDVAAYEPYVDCFDFIDVDLKQEEVLLHVYKDNGNWPGNLNLLIKNLDFNVDNRAIVEDFGIFRSHCGQKCFSGHPCRLCLRELEFAKQVRKEKIRRNQKIEIDNK